MCVAVYVCVCVESPGAGGCGTEQGVSVQSAVVAAERAWWSEEKGVSEEGGGGRKVLLKRVRGFCPLPCTRG